MTEADQTAKPGARRRGGRSFLMMAIVLLVVLVAAGGGALYVFFGYRLGGHGRQIAGPAKPLPFFLEVKPFVVSMSGGTGDPHFVQVGVTMTLSAAALGPLVEAVLPEIQDAMRQTILTFKVDDVMTPAGVDKLRKAMADRVNRILVQRLGAERVEQAAGGTANAVQNIYFTTLIVE